MRNVGPSQSPSAYETILNSMNKNIIIASIKPLVNNNLNGMSKPITLNYNSPKGVNSVATQKNTLFMSNGKTKNNANGYNTNESNTTTTSPSTANMIRVSQMFQNPNYNNASNVESQTNLKASKALIPDNTHNSNIIFNAHNNNNNIGQNGQLGQRSDQKKYSSDKSLTRPSTSSASTSANNPNNVNIKTIKLNKKASQRVISQSLTLKENLNMQYFSQENTTRGTKKIEVNGDSNGIDTKLARNLRSLSTKNRDSKDSTNEVSIEFTTKNVVSSSNSFKFLSNLKKPTENLRTSESTNSILKPKPDEIETESDDLIMPEKSIKRQESANRSTMLLRNAHLDRATPRANSKDTNARAKKTLLLNNFLNDSATKNKSEERSLSGSIAHKNNRSDSVESKSTKKVYLKQCNTSKGNLKLINDENIPILLNGLSDDNSSTISQNKTTSSTTTNMKSSTKSSSQKNTDDKNSTSSSIITNNGIAVQKASLSAFVTKVNKGEDFMSKLNNHTTNDTNNSSTKRIPKVLTLSVVASASASSSNENYTPSKIVKAVITPGGKTPKKTENNKAVFFGLKIPNKDNTVIGTTATTTTTTTTTVHKQITLTTKNTSKIHDMTTGTGNGVVIGSRPLTNSTSPFIYYMTNLEKSHKHNDDDYFSVIYREHFIQTLQAMSFCKILKPVDPKVIAQKKVFLEKRENYKDKKTLVFDLDETLIHCNENNDVPCDVRLPIRFPSGECVEAGINIRPYALEILKELSSLYEIIVFTASHSCYANVVLDYIDPYGQYIHHRLFREACVTTEEGVYIKDLRILANRTLDDIIIVDNAAYSFGYQIDNGIPIIPFYDNKLDEELKNLTPYLKFLSSVKDVREIIRQTFKLSQYCNFDSADKILEKLVYSK